MTTSAERLAAAIHMESAAIAPRTSPLIEAAKEVLKERDALRTALLDCATDLQASVTAEYAGTLDYPVMRRKFERDMEPVARAKELLGDNQQLSVNSEE